MLEDTNSLDGAQLIVGSRFLTGLFVVELSVFIVIELDLSFVSAQCIVLILNFRNTSNCC